LLASPGQDHHCADLADRVSGADQTVRRSEGTPVLDERAREQLGDEFESLQDQLRDAEQNNDVGKIEFIQAQMEAITEQVASAAGLAGRKRKLGDEIERVRKAVSNAVYRARKKLAEQHEELGRHLDASISAGDYLCYRPEEPLSWITE
jgi:predicted  nucleic acid-binding Zn-ribbon protein